MTDGTIQDWRGGLVRHDDGVLDAPRTHQLVDAVAAAATADSVRVVDGPFPDVPVVLIGMSHEYSPGGGNRGQRLSWAIEAAWATCRILIDARHDLGEDAAPLCRRCGAMLDDAQADAGAAACSSCCEGDAWRWTLDGVFGEILAKLAERMIRRQIAHNEAMMATLAPVGATVWKDGKPYTVAERSCGPNTAGDGYVIKYKLQPQPYIVLETTIGAATEAAAVTPIEESNDDA